MADFLMPALGADMETGRLVQWLVREGDRVRRGDVVAVVETHKGAIDVEIFLDGVIRELAPLGQDMKVGTRLARVGLAGYEDKFPWELSGGMQQRASICRALIHKPRLLMLDEPFGALDAFTREELWCLLQELWRSEPFTVILVTHDLREAVFLADTVYVMSKRPGRILMRKPIELARPRTLEATYSEAFAADVHVLREQIGRIRES